MKIGYCVICHKNTNSLRATIEILSKDNDIYLHVDKKANINDFNEYKNQVHFIEERINVRWGRYSQIESMLTLLTEAAKMHFDYICLLSGDCLPLKNSGQIKEFFSRNNGKEFIGIQKKFNKELLENNIKYEYSDLYFKRNINVFDKIILKIQSLVRPFKVSKWYKSMPKLYKGANWFCISGELSNYILEYLQKNNWYKHAFEKASCGDEVFFQTIIMNSIYKDRIYNNNNIEYDDNQMALRYIDWKSGPEYPKILTENDFENIKNNKNFDSIFARKFSENINIDKYKAYFNMQ